MEKHTNKHKRDLKNSMDTYKEEGRGEGREEREIEIAENLINLGLENNLITKATGLSIEEIEKIREEIQNN